MTTDAPKKPTAAEARKERAAKVKEANRIRLEKMAELTKDRTAERKKAREDRAAAKTAKVVDPAKEAVKKEKAEKAKAERDAKEKATAEAVKALAPVAKEVNVRLEKAAKMEKDADDHRLAAALKLKEAEDQCKAAGIVFKKWSDENVKGQSFETVRKLLAVGKADEPMLALQDMRAKNAAANRKLREKQKAERQQPAARTSTPASEGSEGSEDGGSDDEPTLEGMDAIKEAFGELRASEQMEFAEWAAKEVGAKLDMGM